MRHYPIFLDLAGKRALVLGSGEIARRKARDLETAGAAVEIAPAFAPALLDNCALAIGADAPEPELLALSVAAQARGIPVNVVDRPELCSFISPAIVDRDPLTIAISSGGAAPVLARLLRARIESLIAPAWGRLAALAESFQAETRRRLPDMRRRRRLLERTLGGRVADLMLAGDEAGARAAYATALDAATTETAGDETGGSTGIVYLVGAGPGAADLVTLRALRLLGEADVIVHDRLVSDAVLDLARRDAARVFVGKKGAAHSLPQDEINALLVRLGREGRKVVRLKGGDPTVFGRAGEEAEALRAAGIPVEVVPGVTAALAAAAGAQIPLTRRGVASSLTLATAHDSGDAPAAEYAALLRRGGTLALYMGLATLPRIRDALLQAGLDGAMPTAIVESAGTDRQRTLHGTLDSVATRAAAWATGGPVLALVGQAVGEGQNSPSVAIPSAVPADGPLGHSALDPSREDVLRPTGP